MHIVGQRIEIKANNKFKTYCRKAFGISRMVYNYGVERFTKDYKEYIAAMAQYNKELKEYKESKLLNTQAPVKPRLPSVLGYKKDFNADKAEKYPFVYEVTKYASQQPFINLGKAITNYFASAKSGKSKPGKKSCFPKFKKKSYTSGSFYIGGDQVKIKTGVSCSKKLENTSDKEYLSIPRFGYVQLKEKLRFKGHINSVTISQKGDRFFASFSIEITDEEFERTHKKVEQHSTVVGIDFGVKSALVLSDGLALNAPAPLKKNLRKLIKLSRQLSRKQHPRAKGDKTEVSNNYKKFSKKLSKLHNRISNIREDFAHKVTSALIRHYEYFVLEDLNVKGMLSNHRLARAISDIGFYKLKYKLMYKASEYGRNIIEVDRFYPSTKTCSNCGSIRKDITLKDRVYECNDCGFIIDRDLNAAINLSKQVKNIGRATPEFKPVELTALKECFLRNTLLTSSVEAGIR